MSNRWMQRLGIVCGGVLLAGVAAGGDPIRSEVVVESYDVAGDVIGGYPDGSASLEFYQRSAATAHVAGPPPGPAQHPPDPCRRITDAWNRFLGSGLTQEQKYRAFSNLIRGMALKGCSCEVLGLPDPSGAPQELLEIRPLPR